MLLIIRKKMTDISKFNKNPNLPGIKTKARILLAELHDAIDARFDDIKVLIQNG